MLAAEQGHDISRRGSPDPSAEPIFNESTAACSRETRCREQRVCQSATRINQSGWYKVAAAAGISAAQVQLGRLAIMLSKGQGCAPHQSKALTYFTHAADQGLAEAQLVLGEAYRLGRGVEPDQNAARRWYELAARQGNQAASKMLLELQGCTALAAPRGSSGTEINIR